MKTKEAKEKKVTKEIKKKARNEKDYEVMLIEMLEKELKNV